MYIFQSHVLDSFPDPRNNIVFKIHIIKVHINKTLMNFLTILMKTLMTIILDSIIINWGTMDALELRLHLECSVDNSHLKECSEDNPHLKECSVDNPRLQECLVDNPRLEDRDLTECSEQDHPQTPSQEWNETLPKNPRKKRTT